MWDRGNPDSPEGPGMARSSLGSLGWGGGGVGDDGGRGRQCGSWGHRRQSGSWRQRWEDCLVTLICILVGSRFLKDQLLPTANHLRHLFATL